MTRVKSETQWKDLEQCFRELQGNNSEVESFRILTRVVMGGGYNTTNITRGVNRLVDEGDYCNDVNYCRGECCKPHSKKALKYMLHHFAYPRIIKMVRLHEEDSEEEEKKSNRAIFRKYEELSDDKWPKN